MEIQSCHAYVQAADNITPIANRPTTILFPSNNIPSPHWSRSLGGSTDSRHAHHVANPSTKAVIVELGARSVRRGRASRVSSASCTGVIAPTSPHPFPLVFGVLFLPQGWWIWFYHYYYSAGCFAVYKHRDSFFSLYR